MEARSPEIHAKERRPSALEPLRIPIFRNVWLANMTGSFGGLIQGVGASWMMTSMAKSAHMVALVSASTSLPIMMLSLMAGALADNFDRRKVMIMAQTFMLLVSLALSICTWAGVLTPWLLLTFTFLIGCGVAFNGPAWQASVGEMVPREELTYAVTLNGMGFNMARTLGPAVGGVIVAGAGAATAFAINAASYLPLIAVLSRWKPNRPPSELPPERLVVAMAAGVRYVAMSPRIGAVMFRGAVFGLGVAAIPSMMPLVAKNLMGGGPSTFGLLLGAFGVGGVLGGLSVRRVRGHLRNETLIRSANAVLALCVIGIGLSRFFPLTIGILLVCGASWVVVLSTFNVTVQLSSPRWVVARALALYQMAIFGGMAAGSWTWGYVAEAQGVSAALCISAVVQIGCLLLGFKIPLPESADLNLDPLARWREPEIALPIAPLSGPIVVAIEYEIAPEDEVEFLNVMAERRRIRRRDGARDWTLSRDLTRTDVWIERYHTPTWVEYIRHNQRVTHEDAAIADRIRELHKGAEPPRVTRLIERQVGGRAAARTISAQEAALPFGDPPTPPEPRNAAAPAAFALERGGRCGSRSGPG